MIARASHIGPYELVRRLGRGGMAETFVARRRGPGGFVQECCLKCVLPQFADDAAFRDQFLDEATLHGRLSHGNVVRVQDFGEHAGTYFLVMELVDGCDLAQLLRDLRMRGTRLPPALAVLIAVDLCHALAHVHELATERGPLGLVHRDLTPSNVLLSREGEVKLSDFGIARALARRSRTQTGHTKGKVCYMSPEQIEGARDLDARSDLFALGLVLYEMLSGVRAYDSGSESDVVVLRKILQGQRKPLAQLAPDLPAGLCEMVDRLLDNARDQRPASARVALELLTPFAPSVRARTDLAEAVRAACGPSRRSTSEPGSIEPTEPLSALAPRPPAGAEAITHTSASTRSSTSIRRWLPLVGGLSVLGTTATALWIRHAPDADADLATSTGGTPAARRLEASHSVPTATRSDGIASSRATTAAQAPAPSQPTDGADAAENTANPAEADETPTSRRPPVAPIILHDPHVADTAAARGDGEAVPQTPPPARRESDAPMADLLVVAVPYGNIWIDGERRGATRVRVKLKPGRHRVAIGRGPEPSHTREVLLQPGPRTLELELPGAFD